MITVFDWICRLSPSARALVPHITLKSIANNAEIDVIWEDYQTKLEPVRQRLNATLGQTWEEWEIPREAGKGWPTEAAQAHAQWWEARIARQGEIDASIAAKADYEYLYDKPYSDSGKIRVAGPFTVESLSPHRTMAVDQDDELVDLTEAVEGTRARDHLMISGVDPASEFLDDLRAD